MAESGKLRTERDATDLIGETLGRGDRMVVIPVERLDEEFFRLRTGIAGAFLQKFVTYRVRVVIVGDISVHIEKSDALRDFVHGQTGVIMCGFWRIGTSSKRASPPSKLVAK
jgi:hypothetical protein